MAKSSRTSAGRANPGRVTAIGLACLTAVAAGLGLDLRTASAQSGRFAPADAGSVRHVVVTVNKSRLVPIEKSFATAVVGSPEIADVLPMTDRTVYVQGKKIGTTNVSVFDQSMRLITVLDLEVSVDTGELQSKIRASTGSNSIHVSNSNGQVVLSGVAGDAVAADHAVSLAKSVVPTGVVNAMSVAPSQQVLLKVRFLEASRDAGRELGVNWQAINPGSKRGVITGLGSITPTGPTTTTTTTTGSTNNSTSTSTTLGPIIPALAAAGTLAGANVGSPFGVVLANLVNNGTQIDLLLTALETKGLIRRLAEPNLVALSGDTARFLAGGEFPVPISAAASNGTVTPTIEFKRFGVSLTFAPTVLRNGVINLRIAPQVSELDFTNAVTISGTTIPSLVVRDADTTVELRDGQSFAIAGLLQANSDNITNQIPWLGSVPVLGALFRSSAYQKHETDLVIIVTPHLAQPAAPGARLATPFDQRLQGNDVDFFLMGQAEVRKQYNDYVTSGGDVNGPYGHIVPVEPGSNAPVFKNEPVFKR